MLDQTLEWYCECFNSLCFPICIAEHFYTASHTFALSRLTPRWSLLWCALFDATLHSLRSAHERTRPRIMSDGQWHWWGASNDVRFPRRSPAQPDAVPQTPPSDTGSASIVSSLSMSDLPTILMQEAPVQQEVAKTHSRKMSLPFTVLLTIHDREWEGQYCGHGIEKVAYRITGWSHVLKVTKSQDQEPTVFQTLQKHSLCTEVYDVFNVQYMWHQHDRPGKSKARKIQEEFYGWIVQYAESVDRLLVSSEMAYESCICSCLLNIIECSSHGFVMNDPGVYNFGILEDSSVVVIDGGGAWKAGTDISLEPRSVLYRLNVKRFFDKLKWFCAKHSSVDTFCTKLWQIYQDHWLPRESVSALKEAVPSLQVANNAAQLVLFSSHSAATGHLRPRATAAMRAARSQHSENLLNWLRDFFFWKDIAYYRFSSDGTVRWQGNVTCAPLDKLEMLLRVTSEQRMKYLEIGGRQHLESFIVFTEDECNVIFKQWFQRDWRLWMHPETVAQNAKQSDHWWNQTVRRAHRVFLHQLVGCYELVVFFVYVLFSFQNLQAFQRHWYRNTDAQTVRKNAVVDVQRRCSQEMDVRTWTDVNYQSYGGRSDD